MAGFFLSEKAKADVKGIGRYTQEQWGVEQRNRYLGALEGHSAETIRRGYRRIREGSHVVYFHRSGNEVEVVRVLHKRMLPGKHMP